MQRMASVAMVARTVMKPGRPCGAVEDADHIVCRAQPSCGAPQALAVATADGR